MKGNDASLEVMVSGDPQPSVEWYLDKRLLTSKDKRHVVLCKDGFHSLSIKNIQIEDEGVYECVATNIVGTAKCECEILVDG